MQMQYRDLWRSGRPDFTQINWDNLYLANANNLRAGNGAAVYMVEERRSDLLETLVQPTLNKQFNRHLGLTAGEGALYAVAPVQDGRRPAGQQLCAGYRQVCRTRFFGRPRQVAERLEPSGP